MAPHDHPGHLRHAVSGMLGRLGASTIPDLTPSLTWSDWPAARRPGRSLGAAALIVAAVVAIGGMDPWLGALGGAVLVIATAEALLPTRYVVDEDGVGITGPFSHRREPWSRFVGMRPVREGFLLLGKGSRPALKRLRTRLLRCPDQREAVQRVLSQHLAGAPCAT